MVVIVSRPLKSILPFFMGTLSCIFQPPSNRGAHMTVFFPMKYEWKECMSPWSRSQNSWVYVTCTIFLFPPGTDLWPPSLTIEMPEGMTELHNRRTQNSWIPVWSRTIPQTCSIHLNTVMWMGNTFLCSLSHCNVSLFVIVAQLLP